MLIFAGEQTISMYIADATALYL